MRGSATDERRPVETKKCQPDAPYVEAGIVESPPLPRGRGLPERNGQRPANRSCIRCRSPMRCHTAARSSPRGEAAFSRIGGLHPISSHTTRAETCYCTATPTHHAASRFIFARSAAHQSGNTSITSGVTHTVGGLRCLTLRTRFRFGRCFCTRTTGGDGGRGGC